MSTVSYDPDDQAIPGSSWGTAFLVSDISAAFYFRLATLVRAFPCHPYTLGGHPVQSLSCTLHLIPKTDCSPLPFVQSQRDVSLNVPVNFVTQPGVSLSHACFSHGIYEDTSAAKCFSNLLAAGFRRLIVDLYWDAPRKSWSLCPVEVPGLDDENASHTAVSSTSEAVLFSAALTGRAAPAPSLSPSSMPVSSTAVSSSSFRSSTNAMLSTTSTLSAAIQTGISSSDERILTIGPYQCTSTIEFSTLTSLLLSFFQVSSNTLDAALLFLVINVHAAAPYNLPTGPAQQPSVDALPTPDNLLSSTLSSNLSSYLYTPSMLKHQRANLNASWYNTGQEDDNPDAAYFTIETHDENTWSSQNAWPGEGFIEFSNALRLLPGFGTIDPQLADYNASGDADIIFPSDYIQEIHSNVSISTSGTVTSGCLFDNSTTTVTSNTNSSWAISILPSNFDNNAASVSNLTSCGLSPLLNSTLSNATADVSPAPYKSLVLSSLWAWAAQEPRAPPDDSSSTTLRCAVLDPYSLPNPGRWRVTNCTRRLHAACRLSAAPYAWLVSDDSSTYAYAGSLCPDNAAFAVPRTALENAHLLAAVQPRRALGSGSGPDADPDAAQVYLNINSLDKPTCWMPSQGPDAGTNLTCPYIDTQAQDRERTVIVPTVASVIVFVIAVLTVFVKCAANRRSERTKRKGENDGWGDYEGVPS